MIFEEKVRFLRTLPQFKVVPISEVKAIAFAAKETEKVPDDEFVLAQISPTTLITLAFDDIQKIIRVYPDLESKLNQNASTSES